jgi:FHA domain
MNDYVRRTTDWMTETVRRARTLVDPPLDADARPLEVRARVLEMIEARVEPSGNGRRAFPYADVTITLLAEDDTRRAALESVFGEFAEVVSARLEELRCDRRACLFRIEYVDERRDGWSGDQRFAVAMQGLADRIVETIAPPVLQLDAVRGTTASPSYASANAHVRIGRTEDPIDHRGEVRHNDIVFVESAGDQSATVGRAHASIRYHADRREYRIFDDGSANGTRVMRNGRAIPVMPTDPVGVALASGDEIVLGAAVLRVTLQGV